MTNVDENSIFIFTDTESSRQGENTARTMQCVWKFNS